MNLLFLKKPIIILVLLITAISCSDDDSGPSDNGINGTWNLVGVSNFLGRSAVFEREQHLWVFNVKDQEVVVTNVQDENLQILNTGTYEMTSTDSTVVVDRISYDYFFEDGDLYLENAPELDGPVLKFER